MMPRTQELLSNIDKLYERIEFSNGDEINTFTDEEKRIINHPMMYLAMAICEDSYDVCGRKNDWAKELAKHLEAMIN